MDYQNTLTYLYNSVPMFQQVGGSAYKEGLENTRILDEHFGHPHRSFRTIHVAGTNGKGSCSHTLAAILQEAGYRVGLYTSPHLVDFRERIRINGQPIPEEYVVRFVEKERDFFEPLHPSFFELTTAMAKPVKVQTAEYARVCFFGTLLRWGVISALCAVILNLAHRLRARRQG